MPIDNNKYQELFLSEATEHLDSLDAQLIEFEKNIHNIKASDELMRHAHTLKGIAATMNYGEISNLAHSFEGMVENIKNGIAKGGTQLLFGAIDELRKLVLEVSKGKGETIANPLVDKVGELENNDIKEDLEITQKPENFQKLTEIKVKTEKLDKIMDVVAELTLNKMSLLNSLDKLSETEKNIILEAIEENTRLIDELQYQTIQLRLMPLIYVFNRFPRMVRDLAKKENKKISFVISGDEIELDRGIIDIIGEPLVHLLRNAVDHGIETEGEITLSAKREKNQVIISVSDTGKGINWEKLKNKAIKKGKNVSENTNLTDLLFSGISTTDIVTDVSGRGVGMSIVKQKIESLGGKIIFDSTVKKGTTFKIYLPISLAIIKVLLIKVEQQTFAIPLSNIEKLIAYQNLSIQTQANQESVVINETNIPLIELNKVFKNFKINSNNDKTYYIKEKRKIAIIVKYDNNSIGFVADEVISQQDMVVKSISEKLKKQGYFSAMTILGNGVPVPIIDIESIIKKL